MSLYEGAKTRVRVDFELSEEFVVNVGMHVKHLCCRFVFTCVWMLLLNWYECVESVTVC